VTVFCERPCALVNLANWRGCSARLSCGQTQNQTAAIRRQRCREYMVEVERKVCRSLNNSEDDALPSLPESEEVLRKLSGPNDALAKTVPHRKLESGRPLYDYSLFQYSKHRDGKQELPGGCSLCSRPAIRRGGEDFMQSCAAG